MFIDYKELTNWLCSQQDSVHNRHTPNKLNRKSPRLEKHRDFRKSRSPLNTGNWAKKESRLVRKSYQGTVRMKLKENLMNEAYYNVRARDYKTYGWMTW